MWKLRAVSDNPSAFDNVSEGLNSVETEGTKGFDEHLGEVSEGLNSVETGMRTTPFLII